MSLAIICLSYDDGSSKIGPISSLAADEAQRVKALATVDRLQDMFSICHRCCTILSHVVNGMQQGGKMIVGGCGVYASEEGHSTFNSMRILRFDTQ
jgi:hypothetical protein